MVVFVEVYSTGYHKFLDPQTSTEPLTNKKSRIYGTSDLSK